MKDGGPAFPTEKFDNMLRDEPVGYHGMSLRDYFAGQAIIALMSSPTWLTRAAYEHRADFKDSLVANAYVLADKMLEERK